jgi:hypothetical protein
MAMAAVTLQGAASGQSGNPRLKYEAPAQLFHSALTPPEVYESTVVNASIHIYRFRPASRDIVPRFQQTLLREWIAPQYQEAQLAGPPSFGALTIAGADVAQVAQFVEAVPFGGLPRPRMRVLIVSGGAAAMVDAQAISLQAWNAALPSFQSFMATLHVDTGSGSTLDASPPTPASRALAGLYVGAKPKFISAIGPGFGAGSGGFVNALHMYLFSENGRVYRAYDGVQAPGGDIGRFDFDEAEMVDPVNSGRYTIDGGQITLRIGERHEETIVVPMPRDGRLTIGTVEYRRR